MRSVFLIVILLCSGAALYAQTAAVAQQPNDEAVRVRLQTFDKVWSTVNEKHYDPTFGGVDWKKIHDNYLPKATTTASDEELHALLRKMLSELKL